MSANFPPDEPDSTVDPDALPPADGTNAPLDGSQQPSPYGVNFQKLEDVDEELVSTIRSRIEQLERDQITPRLEVVRRDMRARYYFEGKQEIYWSENLGTYLIGPVDAGGNPIANATSSQRMVVRNVYRPHAMGIISALSADKKVPTFWPADPDDIEDVKTAEAAGKITELIYRNNRVGALQVKQNYHFWHGGMAAAYVRYVVDESRFGKKTITVPRGTQTVQVSPAQAVCPQCATPSDPENPSGMCPGCGGPVGPENVQPPVTGQMPILEPQEVADGQEVIDVFGHMEVELPYYAATIHEFPFLTLKTEFHESSLKAAYPHVADKIVPGSSEPMEETERYARLGVSTRMERATSDDRTKMITLRRSWLRPSAMSTEKPEVRERFNQLFPHGCAIVFAGRQFCEAKDESMNDRWVIAHAFPGSGQNRSGLGEDLIAMQDEKNEIVNQRLDLLSGSLPKSFYDKNMISGDMLKSLKTVGDAVGVVVSGPGKKLSDAIYDKQAQTLSPEISKAESNLDAEMEFVCGDRAALQGLSEQNIDTASGLSMAINQAKGRLTLPNTESVEFWAEVGLLGVQTFIANRTDDVKFAVETEGGSPKSVTIEQANLKGNVVLRHEADAAFPVSWSEKAAVAKAMLNSPNPAISGVMMAPENRPAMKRYMGLDDVVIPGNDAREHQLDEIVDLLKSAPMESQVPGMPPEPSVAVDLLLDDHQTHLETGKEWAESEAGIQARKENPNGFQNVRAHLAMHAQALAAAQAPAPPAMEAPGPPGPAAAGIPHGHPSRPTSMMKPPGQPLPGAPPSPPM